MYAAMIYIGRMRVRLNKAALFSNSLSPRTATCVQPDSLRKRMHTRMAITIQRLPFRFPAVHIMDVAS